MNQPLFCGACTALVTPFLDGHVNYPMLEQLIRRQTDAHIPAIVVCGTTGEASVLSDAEKIAIIAKAKQYAAGKCLIITGTGSNSTAHCLELSQAAEKAGADALLIVSPYYNKATEDGLIAHYSTIANNVSIPIILYNVPSRTGFDIPVLGYQKLSMISNIVGVKEASSNLAKISQIRKSCGKDFFIWSGNDELTVPIMSLGGQGVISVLGNLFPELVHSMATAALDGDFDTASEIQVQMSPLISALFREVNPVPVKAAMKLIGYDCGVTRLPLTEAKKDTIHTLHQLLGIK